MLLTTRRNLSLNHATCSLYQAAYFLWWDKRSNAHCMSPSEVPGCCLIPTHNEQRTMKKKHLHGHVALNNGRLHRQQLQYSSIFFIVHLYEILNERHWIQSTNTHGFKQFLSYILQKTKLSTATVHVATSGVPIDLNLIKSLHIQYSS